MLWRGVSSNKINFEYYLLAMNYQPLLDYVVSMFLKPRIHKYFEVF